MLLLPMELLVWRYGSLMCMALANLYPILILGCWRSLHRASSTIVLLSSTKMAFSGEISSTSKTLFEPAGLHSPFRKPMDMFLTLVVVEVHRYVRSPRN